MGEVVAAVDRRIEREVAIKRMRGEATSEATMRFLREAKIQARLDHPAIVPVHELGEDADGRPYFTMKRLAGVTLAERLAEAGPIQPLLRALVDVCFAIQLAHSRGVIHRDLKPSNIMLGDYGEVYVLDWGVARVLAESPSELPARDADTPVGATVAGSILGTPGYMSPEQLRGDAIGMSSDVYALGAILFEILAGEPLHPRPREGAIASTLTQPTVSPRTRRPDRAIAPELDALCLEALAETAEERPSARTLAERIQRYLDGDRDIERRRALAAEYLASARAAIADGRRGDAVAAAGHAVVIDPESREAAELVMSLIVAPPRELPPELERELEADELEVSRERSRRNARAYLGIWSFAVMLPFVEVQSWPGMVALFGIANVMALLSFWNARTGRLPTGLFFAGNFVLVFSRFASPFAIMPVFIVGVTLAMAGRSAVIDRPWTMVAWAELAMIAPLVLEHFGVLASTWSIEDSELRARGTLAVAHGVFDPIMVIFGNLALLAVIAILATQIQRGRRDAQRGLRIQAWHLRHLLPR
jgi:serine/threonine-protein kinase